MDERVITGERPSSNLRRDFNKAQELIATLQAALARVTEERDEHLRDCSWRIRCQKAEAENAAERTLRRIHDACRESAEKEVEDLQAENAALRGALTRIRYHGCEYGPCDFCGAIAEAALAGRAAS